MTEKTGRRLPLGGIRKPSASTTDGTGGGSRARAEILTKLAGNTRHLYEFVSGERVAGNREVAPMVPHRPIPGHDHSGGVYGVPIERVLWSAIWGGHLDSTAGTAISQGRGPQVTVDTVSTTLTLINHDIKTIWIPNCSADGAHRQGELSFRLHTSANVDLTYTFIINGFTNGPNAISTTGSPTESTVVFAEPIWLQPGKLNSGRLEIIATRDAADSTVTLMSASLLLNTSVP